MTTETESAAALPWMGEREIGSASRESQTSSSKSKGGIRKMYLAALASLLYAVAMGMASAYSATATDNMQKRTSRVRTTDEEVSWIGSLVAVGALFGGAAAGYVSNKFGRKGTLLMTSLPFVTGWILIAYANRVAFIFAGRFITGICVGLICATTPAYLVEISTPEVRGLLGSSFQLFVVVGVFLVNLLGSFMSWNWEAIASAVSVVVALIAMCFMPESPRWLVANGYYQEAVKAVQFCQGPSFDAAAECLSINEDLALQPKGLKFKELLQPTVYKPLILAFLLVFFQQFTGSNALLFYTVKIFTQPGSPVDPDLATILVDAMLVLATLLSSVLSDKTGRKSLLILSSVGMGVSLAALGWYQKALKLESNISVHYGWVPLACIIVYIAAFSIGFGPITWLLIAELSPMRFRSLISGTATTCCWGFVFIITKTFLTMVNTIGDYTTYWIYAGFCAISIFFTIFCIPETKGKSFDEINDFFIGSHQRIP